VRSGGSINTGSLPGSSTFIEEIMKHPAGRLAKVASLHLSRDALPAFAAGSRIRGTPEEIEAVVAGSVAHFGRYAVSEKDIIFQVETSTYPNWNGSSQKRTFTVLGDELRYSDAASSAGGRVELVWRRAR
jgi:hypothetical protein